MEGKALVINKKALAQIKDIAQSVFNEERTASQAVILIKALHLFLWRNGQKPTWTVDLE
jgi:hypothetical protein